MELELLHNNTLDNSQLFRLKAPTGERVLIKISTEFEPVVSRPHKNVYLFTVRQEWIPIMSFEPKPASLAGCEMDLNEVFPILCDILHAGRVI